MNAQSNGLMPSMTNLTWGKTSRYFAVSDGRE